MLDEKILSRGKRRRKEEAWEEEEEERAETLPALLACLDLPFF